MSTVKHVITNKKESFGKKCLAGKIVNTVNIIKKVLQQNNKYSK